MKINIHFLIIFIISCLAFVGDIIIYAFNLKYALALIITTIFVGAIFFLLIKKKKIIVTSDFEKIDLILCVAMFFVTIISGIVYPDFVYDTLSYHEYLQKDPFVDKVNFDFFPGRIFCVCLFPLGDRMYYILRALFGYRFAAILSFYTVIVLYYQVKKILKILTNNNRYSSIFAYACLCIISFLEYIGTYYIDAICLVFTVQVLLMILESKEVFEDRLRLYIIAIVCGISIGIKITQFFFIIPLLLFMLYLNIKNFKKIKIIDLVVCIILAVLPYAVYLIDNYKQTGSPLFPYYNSILKSEYFSETDWVDERFTLSGMLNHIIWPIKEGFTYACYGDEMPHVDPLFGIGYIFTVGYLIYGLIKKKYNIIFKLSILAIVCDIAWLVVMKGYLRYGSFVGEVFAIIMFTIIANLFKDKKYLPKFKHWLLTILILETICGVIILFKYCDFKNGAYLFKDREKEEYKISIDGVWGAPRDCVGFVSLVREEGTPIYSLHREYFEDNEKTLKEWEEKIKKNNNKIYTIIDHYNGALVDNHRIKEIEKDGFEVVHVVKLIRPDELPYMNANSTWFLVRLKYTGE